jgi:peroxiredoxin family protein
MVASANAMKKEAQQPETERESASFICSRDTLDGVYPPLLLAINARRQGMDSSVFFTFMGLNAVRKGWAKKVKFHPPGFMGAIPGMCSMATGMMKKKIDNAGIPPIEDMMDMAQAEGVRFVACKMTVDMMELDENKLIEGVAVWTAEKFLEYARSCKLCLFT